MIIKQTLLALMEPSALFTIPEFTNDKKLHDFDIGNFPWKFGDYSTFRPVYRYSKDHPLPQEATSDHSEVMVNIQVSDGSRHGINFKVRSWNVANPAHSKYLSWDCMWRETHIAHKNAFDDDKGQKQYENIKKHQFKSICDAFKTSNTDAFTLVEVHPTKFYDHLTNIDHIKENKIIINKTVYDKNSETGKDEDLSVIMLRDEETQAYNFYSVFHNMKRPMQACDVLKKDQKFTVVSMHAKGAGSQYNHERYQKLGPELVQLVKSKNDRIIILGGDWNTPPAILAKFGSKLSKQLPNHKVEIVFPRYFTHVNPQKPKGEEDQFYATRYDGFMIIYPKEKKIFLEAGSVEDIGYSSQALVKSLV